MADTKPYKILSLDGGGSWAVLQAMALQYIYPDTSNKEILKKFDLVVANSGGSLTMAAMMEKESLQEVIDLFSDETSRKKIFSKLSFWENKPLAHVTRTLGFGPKYKTTRKIEGIKAALPIMGGINLSELPQLIGTPTTSYMVMGFDYDRQRANFFRSNLHSLSGSGTTDDIALAYAVHASSNAPVNYFDEPASFKYGSFKRRFWDGAVGGNNNPSLVGVVEALANNALKENILILSIGTGNNLMPIKGLTPHISANPTSLIQDQETQNLQHDIPKMTKSILQEPPDAASYMAHIVIGGEAPNGSSTRMVRLNPLVQPFWENGEWRLPEGLGESEFLALLKMEMDAVEQSEVDLIKKFGALWLQNKVANQSLRYDDTFQAQIGFSKFKEGLERWNSLTGASV